jgi:hypothetical protein
MEKEKKQVKPKKAEAKQPEKESTKFPVVRNLQNNFFYLYLGNNKFRNIGTGQEGEVDDEKAKDLFVINCEATIVFNEYPMVQELIQKCNLKFDNTKK